MKQFMQKYFSIFYNLAYPIYLSHKKGITVFFILPYLQCNKTWAQASTPEACIIKLNTVVIYGFRNKLECLSLASLYSLV
jgi:hypothetical protein